MKKRKKIKKKEETKEKMQENILNGNHFATGCLFFFLQKEISIKISVFFVFHMNAALYLFHIDSFFCTHPHPYRLPPSLKPSRKTDPNEVTCKKTKKQNKQKKKIIKNQKSKKAKSSVGGGEEEEENQVMIR